MRNHFFPPLMNAISKIAPPPISTHHNQSGVCGNAATGPPDIGIFGRLAGVPGNAATGPPDIGIFGRLAGVPGAVIVVTIGLVAGKREAAIASVVPVGIGRAGGVA
jgi:hypothetical protein